MLTAVKIRLYPTAEQRRRLAIQFGCARYVWNDALEKTRTAYRETGKGLRWSELSAQLPQMKKELPWLVEADAQVLQQSLANLAVAFEGFFAKRARYPKFKSRKGRQSIRYPQRARIEGNRLRLGKVGMVHCVIHRQLIGELRSATVSLNPSGRYYAALLLSASSDEPVATTDGPAIGVDLGILDLVVTSNGSRYANPRHLKRAKVNLKRKQQKLSRKKKGSKSRNYARLLVARAYERVANCRKDYFHKLSRNLINENQVIVFEDLHIRGMLANRHLSQAIGDAGWATLRWFCEYKARREGKVIVIVDRWFPSTKACNTCGHVIERLDLDIRSWTCPRCSAQHDRDVNAAKNIRGEGLRTLAGRTPATAAGGDVSRASEARPPANAVANEGRSS